MPLSHDELQSMLKVGFTSQQLKDALEYEQANNCRLDQALIALGFLTGDEEIQPPNGEGE